MAVTRRFRFTLTAIQNQTCVAAFVLVCFLSTLTAVNVVFAADPATPAAPASIVSSPVAPANAPTNWSQAALKTTASGKKVIAAEGRTVPLFWADGIRQISELDDYARTGFNTVVVHVSWRPTPDGALVLEDLEPQRAFAAAAAERGLGIIYSLPAAPFGMERSLRINATSNSYFLVWDNWVQGVIEELKGTRNLLGWMLPDDPRGLTYFDDISFRKWITENYADIGVLNFQWGSSFESLDTITIEGVQNLVKQWRGFGDITSEMSEEEVRARAAAAERKPTQQNFAFHPAALALARFKWTAYRELLTRWSTTIETADPARLLFSGQLPDYAQLLSLPPNIDVSVPDIHPGVAENDFATHNPQAVDIARRGGRFAVMPVLSTGDIAPPDVITRLLPAWADAALAHGASGLVFTSWEDLKANENLHNTVAATLRRLQTPTFGSLWDEAPVATTAIVLTPLADGHTHQIGSDIDASSRGVYGFGEDIVNGEPNGLVYALRWGTAFGSIDYLSPDECVGPDAIPLKRYSTIFMPQALSVSTEMAQNITSYAAGGGVVVADLGAGAAQAGGRGDTLPVTLSALFGVAPEMQLLNLSFNLQLLEGHSLLPTWSRQIPYSGNASRASFITGGDGPDGAAFAGPLGFAPILTDTIPLALAFQLPQQLGGRSDAPLRWQRSTLTLHEVDRGYAIFAPFRLWTFWRPGQNGFDGFHGDLMARDAAVVQQEVRSLVPSPPRSRDSDEERPETYYPEIVNYPNAIALLNHNTARLAPAPAPPNPPTGSSSEPPSAPPPDQTLLMGSQYSQVQTAGVGNFLWSNGVCLFLNGADISGVGRPAPIPDADAFESQPHLATLFATIKPQESTIMRLLPVRAQNIAGGSLAAHVATYEPGNASFMVWPNAETVTPLSGEFHVGMAPPGTVRLTLHNTTNATGESTYRVPPNSRHRVTIMDVTAKADKNGKRPSTTQVVVADATGRLKVEVTGIALMVTVQPEG